METVRLATTHGICLPPPTHNYLSFVLFFSLSNLVSFFSHQAWRHHSLEGVFDLEYMVERNFPLLEHSWAAAGQGWNGRGRGGKKAAAVRVPARLTYDHVVVLIASRDSDRGMTSAMKTTGR